MNKPLLILFLNIARFTLSQNLVANPSFEVFDTCPTGVSTSWDFQIENCTSWYAPSSGTSDYFNGCSPSGGVNVPYAAFGFQSSFDGDGMLGVMLLIQEGEPSYFEYVQSKLISPLQQGYKYKFSFHLNLANGSDYSVENVGAWFTTNAVNSINYQPIFSTLPQIQNLSGFISDTAGWKKIEGEFVADGGEEYITIGYYSDTLAPDTLRNNPDAVPVAIYSYYYIDGLELKEVEPELIIPNVITPNGDGINDVFELSFLSDKISILNRWGNLLWSGSEGQYWNGTTQDGVEVIEGSYFYIIETANKKYQGFVQVVR